MRNGDKKTILVVDDESNVRELIHRILSKDYKVLEAADGQDAVNLATAKIPDVILMDLMMPRMDGLAACFAIKNNESTKKIPVLMLTAFASEGNSVLAQEVWGADRYLAKPFVAEDLLNTLTQVTKRLSKDGIDTY